MPAANFSPSFTPPASLEERCVARGMRMTEQRRIIARLLQEARDHPDVSDLHRRAAAIDASISIATIYRTVRLFLEAGMLEQHDFRDGKTRYETVPETHHDHLIDLKSGRVVEFCNPAIEKLQEQVARELGFRLVDHRLELYGEPLKGGGSGDEPDDEPNDDPNDESKSG